MVYDHFAERPDCATPLRWPATDVGSIQNNVRTNSQSSTSTNCDEKTVVSKNGKPLFVVPTAYPKTPQVTLYIERWEHITQRHPEIAQQSLLDVAANIAVVFPTDTPNVVMFVNRQITTPGGTLLSVIVHEEEASIITAYYNRPINLIPMSQALWLLPAKK